MGIRYVNIENPDDEKLLRRLEPILTETLPALGWTDADWISSEPSSSDRYYAVMVEGEKGQGRTKRVAEFSVKQLMGLSEEHFKATLESASFRKD